MDAGGSKIDAALLARDGSLLGAARWVGGIDEGVLGSLDGIVEAIGKACAGAGIDASSPPLAHNGVFCVTRADFPRDERSLASALAKRRLTLNAIVHNDTFAVLRAGTDRNWGIGVVCGFGINCTGVSPEGRILRFPALGPTSGDWGGGADVGLEGLRVAVRSQDGRGPKTSLQKLVPAHFGLRTPRQVTEALHFGGLEENRLTELAPVVFYAALDDDRVAEGIVDRQADEVVALASTAAKRLRITALDVEVVLGGGIFRNENPGFFARIRNGIREVVPDAILRVLRVPPVVGAALLGLDELSATRAARELARAALTNEQLWAYG